MKEQRTNRRRCSSGFWRSTQTCSPVTRCRATSRDVRVLVRREAGLEDIEDGAIRWSIDHVFLDQDGVPTFVEVKRSSDSRIRREVIGQMLDYAAHAVALWPGERLLELLTTRCERDGLSVDAEVSSVLGPDADAESYWAQAAANLKAGRVRLVFVLDEIPSELRRVVEFLNGQMRPAEVVAIEVKQFVGEGFRGLVPSVIGWVAGAEGRKRQCPDRADRVRDRERFVAQLERNEGSRKQRSRSGSSTRGARFRRRVPAGVRARRTARLSPSSRRTVSVSGRSASTPTDVWRSGSSTSTTGRPFDDVVLRRGLLGRLNVATGLSWGEEVLTRRPAISLQQLVEAPSVCESFHDVLAWVHAQLDASGDHAGG